MTPIVDDLELQARQITRLGDLPTSEEARIAVREGETAVAEVVDDEALPALSTPPPTSAELAMYREQYRGIAQPFDERVSAVLAKYRTVDEADVELKPDTKLEKAQPYLAHTKARDIFNEAFGYGGWAVEPVGKPQIYEDGKKIVVGREFRFYAHGRYIRTVMGAGTYYTTNPNADFSDAYETAESEAIRRATKAFGIAQNLWDEDWRIAWKKKYAVQGRDARGDLVWMKRRKDAGAVPTPEPPAPRPAPYNQAPDIKQRPSDDAVDDTYTTAIIAPRGFGKIWEQGGYVLDDDNKQWSFRKALLPIAEQAILSGKRLRVTYQKKGKYLNVSKCEVVE